MKWMKHMTASWDDERVARLVDAGGMEGAAMYGIYWRVQEIIASQMEGPDPSCSVRYSVTRWSLLLSLRGSLVFSTLSRLGVSGLVTVERDGSEIRVTNRNLLKYRDEYARKSGHSPDNIPARTELEGEGEQNHTKKQKKTIAQSSTELHAEASPIGSMSCVGEPKTWYFTQAKVDEWQNTYPAVQVIGELRKARQWLIDNPALRKTHKGMPRYLNGWLSKAQNESHGGYSNGKANRSGGAGRFDRNLEALKQAAKTSGDYAPGCLDAEDGRLLPEPGNEPRNIH